MRYGTLPSTFTSSTNRLSIARVSMNSRMILIILEDDPECAEDSTVEGAESETQEVAGMVTSTRMDRLCSLYQATSMSRLLGFCLGRVLRRRSSLIPSQLSVNLPCFAGFLRRLLFPQAHPCKIMPHSSFRIGSSHRLPWQKLIHSHIRNHSVLSNLLLLL